MKLKHLLLLQVFIFASAIESFSQNYSTDWGIESVSKEGMPPLKTIGEYKGDVYLLKGRYAAVGGQALVIIEKYSGEDQHLVYSNEIKMPKTVDGKSTDFENIYLINGKLILITSYYKDIKSFVPEFAYGKYVSAIDENGIPSKEAKTIYEIQIKTKDIYPYFLTQIGPEDNSAIFVYSNTISEGKLHGQLIDSDLNITKDVDIDLPYQSSYSLNNFTLTNNHLNFIVEEELPKSEWFNADEKKHTYKLVDFDLKSRKQKKVDLKIEIKNPVLNVQIDIHNNSLFVTGNNVDATLKKANSCGTFLIKFNAQTLEQTGRFENQMPTGLISKITEKDAYFNALYYFSTKKIIELPSGGYIITSNQKYNQWIYVQIINSSGKLESSTVVPIAITKGESETNESFYEFYKNNTLYLLCNDSKKNLDLPDPFKLKEQYCDKKNAIIELITIDNKAQWKKEQLFEDITDIKTFYPLMSQELSPTQAVIFNQKGKKVQFLKIKY